MHAFHDLLETTVPAAATPDARNLTSLANVKAAMLISNTDSDAVITASIPRVSQKIADYCRLAVDASRNQPTFARETLRATWFVDVEPRVQLQDPLLMGSRGSELYLPWRGLVPISITGAGLGIVEDGITLVDGTDFAHLGGGTVLRLSGAGAALWSSGKIVVTYTAGFLATPDLVTNIDKTIEAAAIEQVKYLVMSADRDPAIRLEYVHEVVRVDYSVPGGDILGADALLPAVRDMLAPHRRAVA